MRRIVPMAAAVALMTSGCGGGGAVAADATTANRGHEAPAIARAVRGTLADYIRRDAQAFCGDFTAEVAARLVKGNANCQAGVAPALAPQPGQATYYAPNELPNGLKVSRIRRRGNVARLTSTWPWPDIRKPVDLTLQKMNGRWLIATPTRIVEERFCSRLFGELHCNSAYGVRFGTHAPWTTVSIERKQPCHRHVEPNGAVWESGSC